MKKGGFSNITKSNQCSSPPLQKRKQLHLSSKESSSSELLVLMKEMREEMSRRDEQLMEELRWRDDYQVTENKKREENFTALPQQRDGD